MADGHRIAMALRAAYLTMHRQAGIALQAYQLTPNQYVILAVLMETDGLTQRELVDRTASDANTIRPVLLALEQRGLVERSPHPSDGRAWSIGLTSAGRSLFRTAQSGTEHFRSQLAKPFAGPNGSALVAMLEQLAEQFSRNSQRTS